MVKIPTKIVIGYDHNGYQMRDELIKFVKKLGFAVQDIGCKELNPNDDFPDFAQEAVMAVLADDNTKAILICGGGQGMCMAANRFKGIRASVLWDAFEAKMTRNDNDANICCLPGRIMTNQPDLWQDIVESFLMTPFAAAARFKRRNAQIDSFN